MRSSNTASGQSADRRAAALRQMTADQLLDLGTRQVVYLRAGTYDGERLFVLYAADGEPLARNSQSAPTARFTSGGRIHPGSCR